MIQRGSTIALKAYGGQAAVERADYEYRGLKATFWDLLRGDTSTLERHDLLGLRDSALRRRAATRRQRWTNRMCPPLQTADVLQADDYSLNLSPSTTITELSSPRQLAAASPRNILILLCLVRSVRYVRGAPAEERPIVAR